MFYLTIIFSGTILENIMMSENKSQMENINRHSAWGKWQYLESLYCC